MRNAIAMISVWSLTLAACGDGCQCTPPVETDAGPEQGRLVISSPLNGATLTDFDDDYPSVDGINIDVLVVAENLADGTLVQMGNSAGGSGVDPVAVFAGRARFEQVTLVAGDPPDGQLNTLSVSASGAAGDSVDVTVLGQAETLCRFVSPTDGALLSEDSNSEMDYFQTDVVVACAGSALAADAEVALTVNDGSSRRATLSAGQATFTGVTLNEGDNSLAAHSFNIAGDPIADTQISVEVDTGACDAVLAAPAPGVLNASNQDLDLTTPDLLDIALTVRSQRCPSGNVSVALNGVAQAASAQLSQGEGTIQVALAQGFNATVAIVQDDSRSAGRSPVVDYQVDTVVPELSVSEPQEGAILGAADDEEIPPNSVNGLTYTLSGVVTHPEDSRLSIDVLHDSVAIADSPFDVTVDPLSGAFSRTLVNLSGGAYQADFYVVDTAGNSASLTVNFVIDMAIPVTSLVISSDVDQNDVLNIDEDGSADADYQVNLQLTVTGVEDPTLYAAELRAQRLGAGDAPQGDPIVVVAPFTAQGTADLVLTLSDVGRYDLRSYALRGGQYSEPSAEHIALVDFVAPDLVINSPANSSIRGERSLDLLATTGALDFDPASPVLAINGQASSVSPFINAGTITYNGLQLTGANNDTYDLVLSISDIAGNSVTTSVQVIVDQVPPTVTVSGWASPSASTRHVELSADMSSPTWLHVDQDATLDYDLTTDGLQFGFMVVVSAESALTLGADPQVSLEISGRDQPLFASLVENGGQFEAYFDGAGAGLSLDDGPFDVSAAVRDLAGNSGSDKRYAMVQTSQYYVQISDPAEGQRFNVASGVSVAVLTSVYDGASCSLSLDGNSAGDQTVSSGSLSFADVDLGSEGAHSLQVTCDLGAGETQSSQVRTVYVDTTGPAGLDFVRADTDTAGALPSSGFYNLAWVSTGTRFARALQIQLDAEAGQCGFADPGLLVTPLDPAGAAVNYTADGQSGGQWTLVDSHCIAQFSDVDLAELLSPGQNVQLDVSVTDLAGNPATAQTTVMIDRVAPSLVQTFPADGVSVLGSAYDDNPSVAGLQMQSLTAWKFDLSDRALVGDVVLNYTGVSTGVAQVVAVSGTRSIGTDWSVEGTYSVTVAVQDEAGNIASLATREYLVDVSAPTLQVYDKDSQLMADALQAQGPFVWDNTYDVSASSGGQFDLSVRIDGVREAFDVRLCSDNPPSGASTPCSLAADGSSQGTIVATATLLPQGGGSGLVDFSSINLPQGLHHVYAEADDSAGNHAATFPAEVNIDTEAPQLSAISVVGNNISNDAACTGLCLGIGETPSDVVVSVSSASDGEDLAGRQVTLSSSVGGDLGTVALAGSAPSFTATFSNITLEQGAQSLVASMTDAIGNTLNTLGASNPALFVDTVAPVIAAHSPLEEAQYAASSFDITVTVNDGTNSPEGYAVTLTNTTTSATDVATIPAAETAVLFANQVMTDNATNSLSASVVDRVGNASAAYPFTYDVDTSAPSLTLLAPSGELSRTQTGGACMVISDYHVAVAGINRSSTTQVQLLARAWGSSGNFGVVSGSSAALAADSADYNFASPCFGAGDWEVQARVYETDTLHQSVQTYSGKLSVDLQSPVVSLAVAATSDLLTSGYAFLANLDENATVGSYATSFTVESLNAHQGATARLYVNGSQVGGDQALGSDLTYTFTGVALRDFGATGLRNDVYAEVEDAGVTGTSNTSVDCIADGDVPTIAFNDSGTRTVLYVNDSDHAAAGWQALSGQGLGFTTTGIGTHETVNATMHCTSVVTDETKLVVSNAGEFVDIPGLVTSTTAYTCNLSVADTAGNPATSTTLSIDVDIDRPAIPVARSCTGEQAGDPVYDTDDNTGDNPCYDSASFGGACGNGVDGIDASKCSRRAANVSLTFTAPGENGSTGGNVDHYRVRYAARALSADTSCTSTNMLSATTIDPVSATIVAPGNQQTLTLQNLPVHQDYCFEVSAVDANGNVATGALLARRVQLIEIETLTGTTSSFGKRASFSGDLDGDGLADLVLSERTYNGDQGRVIVHYANSASDTVITGATGRSSCKLGWAVTTGDFNGDGIADVATSESCPTSTYDGRVYLYFGETGVGLANKTANAADSNRPSLLPDVVIDAPWTWFGYALSNRPLNMDGDSSNGHSLDDLVVFGWAGASYYVPTVFVYRGRTTWPASVDTSDVNTKGADMIFTGTDGSSETILTFTAGDFDNDGRSDLVVPVFNSGAPGAAYVIYGRDPLPASLSTTSPTSSLVFPLASPRSDDNYATFAMAFEANGDNASDLAIFEEHTNSERVYFYTGTEASQIALGGAIGSNFVSIADTGQLIPETLGDINGDGIADLCLGHAIGGELNFYATPISGTTTTVTRRFDGGSSTDFGSWVAGGGDFDGDGYNDLAVSDSSGTGRVVLLR